MIAHASEPGSIRHSLGSPTKPSLAPTCREFWLLQPAVTLDFCTSTVFYHVAPEVFGLRWIFGIRADDRRARWLILLPIFTRFIEVVVATF